MSSGPLVWLALLALPLHALPGWPLQPAELLALPLLAYCSWRLARGARLDWNGVDAGVASWVAAVLVSVTLQSLRGPAPDAVVLLDVSKTLYLGLLYLAARVACQDGALRTAPLALVAGAVLASLLGLLGALSNQMGGSLPWAFSADSAYPYLGAAARARAFSATPNMLASIAMLALLLLAAGAVPLRGAAFWPAVALLALGFAATLSKTVVPLAVGLLVVFTLRRSPLARPRRLGFGLAWSAGILSFSLLAHVALVCGETERARLERGMFIAGEPLPLGPAGRCALYRTNYAFNKRASILAIERSWPLGIGPGRHAGFVARLQDEGAYPATLWQAMPHSSYTGTAAELGLAGVLGLAALAAALVRHVGRALGRVAPVPLAVAAAGALAAISIEAIATDVMHFRHYAWLLALVASARAVDGSPRIQSAES